MSNDNKTLADVQPGGRVRLGDGLRSELLDQAERLERMAAQDRETGESIEQALEAGEEYTPDDAPAVAAGLQHDANRSEEIAALLRKAAAALATQPSPGGQGEDARVQFDALMEANSIDTTRWGDGEYTDPAAHNYWRAWQAALAARQPVGEPVAWYYGFSDTGEAGPVTFGGNPGAEAIAWAERHGHTLHYLYAAPPAQAVDLGQFRGWLCTTTDGVATDWTLEDDSRLRFERMGRTIEPIYAASTDKPRTLADALQGRRNRLMNSYGNGAREDAAIDTQIAEIDAELAKVDSQAVGNG